MIDNETIHLADRAGAVLGHLPPNRFFKQKGGGVPGPSKAQQDLEKEQLNLVREQIAELERQRAQPTPQAPKALPPLPPPNATNSADAAQAEADARRKSLRRFAPGRSTIFAGESGGALGGPKTLLG